MKLLRSWEFEGAIIDADGTVFDSFGFFQEILCELLKTKQKMQRTGIDEILKLFKIGSNKRKVVQKIIDRMARWYEKVQAFEEREEVLFGWGIEWKNMFMVSSNSEKNLRRALEANSLESYFVEVIGNDGKNWSKIRQLEYLIKKYRLVPSDTLGVTDELRDVRDFVKVWIVNIAHMSKGYMWKEEFQAALKEEYPELIIHSYDSPAHMAACLYAK